MTGFSAGDVALTGFGVIKRRPSVLIWWTLFHGLMIAASTSLLVIFAGPALMQMRTLSASGAHDPATSLALLRQIAPAQLVLLPLMAVFYSMLYAAMNRAVLRPEKALFGYLRLGADELRQFGLFLLTLLTIVGACVATFLLVIAGVAAFNIASAKFAPMPASAPIFAGLAGELLLLALWIYVGTRLALAPALTFDTKRVNLFGSWKITRRQFWPILGASILTLFISLVVGLVGMIVLIVCSALFAKGAGSGLAFVFHPDMSSLKAYMTPVRIAYLGLSGLLYAVLWPVMLTPLPAIYKALTDKPAVAPAAAPPPEPEPAAAPAFSAPEPSHPEPAHPEPAHEPEAAHESAPVSELEPAHEPAHVDHPGSSPPEPDPVDAHPEPEPETHHAVTPASSHPPEHDHGDAAPDAPGHH